VTQNESLEQFDLDRALYLRSRKTQGKSVCVRILPSQRMASGNLNLSRLARQEAFCVVSGYDFSRNRKGPEQSGALAPAREPEDKPPISSTPVLVGTLQQGELDFSPAERRFVSKGLALALDFPSQR
jgi:hypothetical protein